MEVLDKELQELEIPADVDRLGDCAMRCGDETILAFFVRLVSEGTSLKMAEALALQQSPGIGITDTLYIADQNRHGRSILDRMNGDPVQVEALRKGLAANGYKLQADDHYISPAARFANDPQAVVNHKQTLGDLKRRIAERGTAVAGEMSRDADIRKPKRKPRLNPRIVNRIDRAQVAENPDLLKTPQADRQAEIISKHGAAASRD
jgi:hypothetical protein